VKSNLKKTGNPNKKLFFGLDCQSKTFKTGEIITKIREIQAKFLFFFIVRISLILCLDTPDFMFGYSGFYALISRISAWILFWKILLKTE
jgi:hypothetical protein